MDERETCKSCEGDGKIRAITFKGIEIFPLETCMRCSGSGKEPESIMKFASGLQLEDEEFDGV